MKILLNLNRLFCPKKYLLFIQKCAQSTTIHKDNINIGTIGKKIKLLFKNFYNF
jgi:hypothetical protein